MNGDYVAPVLWCQSMEQAQTGRVAFYQNRVVDAEMEQVNFKYTIM